MERCGISCILEYRDRLSGSGASLQTGSNGLSIVGVDIHGQVVSGTSNLVSVIFNLAPTVTALAQVVINEIIINPERPVWICGVVQ